MPDALRLIGCWWTPNCVDVDLHGTPSIDLGYSDVGCFGSEIRTPNIDRIAREGIQFTDCKLGKLVLDYTCIL